MICVLGNDPFGPILDKITSGETINGRKIIDKRVSHPQEARDCSILFISSSEEEHLRNILATLHDAPVLTVSDMSGFVEHGGMIQFISRWESAFCGEPGPDRARWLVVEF